MTHSDNATPPLGLTRSLLIMLPTALVITAADQLTKQWALNELVENAPAREFIGEFIQLRLIFNPGAAFSFASGMTWILTLVSAAVIVYIAVMSRKLTSKLWAITLAMLLGGALGNLIDRLFRDPGFPTGHVVDFLDYGPFVGNVADIFIVGAAILLAVLSIFGVPAFVDNESLTDGDEESREDDQQSVQLSEGVVTDQDPESDNGSVRPS
ncbi:signal peptidase II [Jonesia quinghaiensis]|uniref:signal peptidase II n=1 Tax=Jonesia quinghaiensis TaxID=262806 RepID=UPI000A063063|nr:signal peptidase II [Jonesia quinghaiensis]